MERIRGPRRARGRGSRAPAGMLAASPAPVRRRPPDDRMHALTRTRRFPGAWTSHAIRSTHAIRSSSTKRHAAWSTKTPNGRAPIWTMCCCGMSGERSQSQRLEMWWPRSTACATRLPSLRGLLGGTFRAEQLEAGTIQERVLTKADIASASRLWLINSVRGWVEAILVVGSRR